MEKTVVKALTLLETLAAHGRPRRVSELGRELGMAKSNVHRLLRTLVQLGFARQDEHGLYAPSLKSWELGVRVLSHITVQRVAGDHLKRLAASSTEQVNLAIRDGAEVLYIAVIEATHIRRAHPVLGRRAPLHCVASGKAILAYQSDAEIRAIAKPLVTATPRSIASGERLRAELAEVRRRGFAMNLSEWRNGVHGVAAPIPGPDGQIDAAVSIAGPAERLQANRLRALGPEVVETASAIALDLAYAAASPDARAERARLAADEAPAVGAEAR